MQERRTFRERAKIVAKKSVQFLKKLSPERAISKMKLNRKLRNAMSDKIDKINIARAMELVQKGADPNLRNADGYTPLLAAAWNGDAEACAFFIEKGADVNAREDIEGTTPLMLIAKLGHDAKIAKLLLKNGAYVDARDYEGRTALMNAVNWNRARMARFLLMNGADPNATDGQGIAPISMARGDVRKIFIIAYLTTANGWWSLIGKESTAPFLRNFMACIG